MTESPIVFNLPGLYVLDRIDELQEYITNFPDSRLVPVFQKEIDELEALAKYL